MNRAQRRHETERVKASFYRKQKDRPWWATTQASAGMYANHGKTCSCWMCGNPRKFWGSRTLAEARADYALREWDE